MPIVFLFLTFSYTPPTPKKTFYSITRNDNNFEKDFLRSSLKEMKTYNFATLNKCHFALHKRFFCCFVEKHMNIKKRRVVIEQNESCFFEKIFLKKNEKILDIFFYV
jgi:hypothetical protein